MFNSTILDVAIGLIFVYLLLSLMCSAANELIELALKKRAIDLERGIRELLAPGSDSGTNDVVQALYNHPLVNSLFGGKYEESRIENTAKRKIFRTALPSYIPSRTFALALMDLVLPGVTVPPAGGPAPAAGGAPAAPVAARASGTAGATPPPENFEVTLAAPPPAPLAVTNPANPLADLRAAVGTNPILPDHAKVALTSLIDAAGNDVAKARENIETWFNSSMDRVSSWYKRRTQIVILIVGLFVTVGMNADTVTIVRKLSTDKALRESLVAAAQEYAKANASPEAAATSSPAAEKPKPVAGTSGAGTSASASESPAAKPSPPAGSSPAASPASSPATSPAASPAASHAASPASSPAAPGSSTTASATPKECVTDPNSAACRNAKLLQSIPACQNGKEDSPACKYAFNQSQIESLSLPLGWSSTDDPQRKWPTTWDGEGGWTDQIYWHFMGWLLTTIALSLGAPFWFDLLNKFIVIRSAVKPHEKSPEEKSKG